MPKNAIIGTGGLIFVAASILFTFFIILPGVTSDTPFSKTYFLQADTRGITGARDVSQWTYFYICGPGNNDCGSAHAATPFGYAWDGNARNVPDGLGGSHGGNTTSSKYFYLWRFGWVFIMIALFFQVMTLFTSLLACCGRLGAALAFAMSTVALFFQALACSLTTAVFVLARNSFNDAGRSASVGRWGFGFLWASFAALLISMVLFTIGTRSDAARVSRRRSSRSARGRSFDGRRVKDEYS